MSLMAVVSRHFFKSAMSNCEYLQIFIDWIELVAYTFTMTCLTVKCVNRYNFRRTVRWLYLKKI